MDPVAQSELHPGLGVILLGAGASSRMGQPKLLLPWGNTSVIGHLVQQWRTLGADQIVIVCRAEDAELHTELDRLRFPLLDRIVNPKPERGMFSSIQCAACWPGWQETLGAWAVVLGDQPHLRTEMLRHLLDFQRQHADAICQPAFDGRARHPVVLPERALGALRESGADTFRDFLQGTSFGRFEYAVDDAGLSLDLDRPEHYQTAKTLYLNTP